jgi:hypothetical protein
MIVKMHAKSAKTNSGGKNLSSLCDVDVILGLSYILLLLECVRALIKIALNIDIFVCDFVDFNFCESSPTRALWLYCDLYVKFEDPTFNDFNAIKTLTNNLLMDWFSNLNGSEDDVYLAFCFLTISTMFTTLVKMVLQVYNLSPRTYSNRL